MDHFVLLLLNPMVWLIVCAALIYGIICGPGALAEFRKQRKWETVKKNSKYYQKLMDLNARTRFHTAFSQLEWTRYVSRSQTMQDFESMDEKTTLKHLLQGVKRTEIERFLREVDENRKICAAYEAEFQQLQSTVTEAQCKGLGVSYGDFLAMESMLGIQNKLVIPVDFMVQCVIDYSVMGESIMRKSYFFSERELRAGMEGHFEEIEQEIEELRRKQERNRITPSVRYQVIKRDGGRCRLCGRSAQDGVTLEVDHIIPIAKGGNSDEDNLQTLCRDCNRGKGVS